MAPSPSPKVTERKREILAAASRVFRRKGLYEAGMRDIAAELGMTAGNLYYYFQNKQEILAFCQEDALEGLDELARHVAVLPARADTRLYLLIVGHVVRLNEGTPGSLAHLEAEALEGKWRRTILARRRQYEQALRELVAAGIAAGTFRGDADPLSAAMAILGAMNWSVKWFRPEGRKSAREIGGEIAAQMVRGLLAPGVELVPPVAEQVAATIAAARGANEVTDAANACRAASH